MRTSLDRQASRGLVSLARIRHRLGRAPDLHLAAASERNGADNTTPEILIRPDDGIIAHSNSSWNRMLGYDEGELAGRHISVVSAPADERVPGQRLRDIVSHLERTGSWHADAQFVRKDGNRVTLTATISERDDASYGTVWVMVAAPPLEGPR